jgi:hypothetical protein
VPVVIAPAPEERARSSVSVIRAAQALTELARRLAFT